MKLSTCPRCKSKKVELFFSLIQKQYVCMPCLDEIVNTKGKEIDRRLSKK